MSFVELDESRFPLVVATFLGTASDAEFDAYLARIEMLWARKQRYAIILDASRNPGATARQRSVQARWLADHAVTLGTFNVGCAFVMTSALVRGIATAVFWLQPMPMPHTIVSTRAEAERWCLQRLEAVGIPRASLLESG